MIPFRWARNQNSFCPVRRSTTYPKKCSPFHASGGCTFGSTPPAWPEPAIVGYGPNGYIGPRGPGKLSIMSKSLPASTRKRERISAVLDRRNRGMVHRLPLPGLPDRLPPFENNARERPPATALASTGSATRSAQRPRSAFRRPGARRDSGRQVSSSTWLPDCPAAAPSRSPSSAPARASPGRTAWPSPAGSRSAGCPGNTRPDRTAWRGAGARRRTP